MLNAWNRTRRRGWFLPGLGGISGILYRLRDSFSTNRAAGSVNGTLAEPTGQARVVTDTHVLVSLSGGQIVSAAGGSAGGGDPGIWWESESRIAGKMMIVTVKVTASIVIVGWSTAQSGFPNEGFFFNAGGILDALINLAVIAICTYTLGVNYKCITILRTNGAWILIKGGTEFSNMILIYAHATGGAANEFAELTVFDATGAYSADDVKIPDVRYLLAPFAYDTFTRANGVLGSTETLSPDGLTLAALAWLFTAGIWTTASNNALATPNLGADAIVNGGFGADANWNKGANWTIGTGTANAAAASSDLTASVPPLTVGRWYQIQYTVSAFAAGTVQAVMGGQSLPTHAANGTYTEIIKATSTAAVIRGVGFTGSIDNVSAKVLTTAELFSSVQVASPDVLAEVAITLPSATSGLQAGIVVNLDDAVNPQNYIVGYIKGDGTAQVDQCIAGVISSLGSGAITYAAGGILRMWRMGTLLALTYNGNQLVARTAATANVNTKVGQFSTSPLITLKNFTAWPVGTAGELNYLDTL